MRLVYIALGWAAGILAAATFPGRGGTIWLALAAATLLIALRLRPRPIGLTLAATAFALGGLRFSLVPLSSDLAQYNNVGGMTLEGVVVAEPDVRDDRVGLRLQVETVTRTGQTVSTNGLALVEAPRDTPVRYGDRIRATGLLVAAGESDTFSYADFLARSGVYSLMPGAAVEVVSSGHGNALYAALLDIKQRARQAISLALPEPVAALLTGILLGDQRGLSPDVSDAFARTGTSHVIAISGFNMAVLSGVVMALLERFRLKRWRAAIVGLAVIGLYTLLVGASAAVVRAALMSGMLVIGGVIRRKTFVPASIAFVAVLLSALNPTVLWDVSFQLSLFATLGLALFANPLERWLDSGVQRVLPGRGAALAGDFLTAPLAVTLAAQIATLPLIVLYFGRLSIVSLAVNMLIVPAQSILLLLGLAAALVALFVPALGQILFWLDLIPLGWTLAVVRLFARLPFADADFHVDPRLITLFYLLVLGGALMQATQATPAVRFASLIRRRAVLYAVIFSGFALFILMGALGLSRPDGMLHVWLLDVGHSNGVLVQTPGGAHILVDGGRFPSRLLTALGDRLPFNDREIETLVITQADEFDVAALDAVLDRYNVGLTVTNGQTQGVPVYEALLTRLSSQPMVVARAGYWLEVDDGVRIDVLHPGDAPDSTESLDANALVLRLTYGDISFLLPGDLSREGQDALLASGQWPLATVLQLPKHGGIRSLGELFLSAVQPQAAAVQIDPANRLGDPDADTLALLGERPVFRTDLLGTLHFWTDGRELWAVGSQ